MRRWLALVLLFILPFQGFSAQAQIQLWSGPDTAYTHNHSLAGQDTPGLADTTSSTLELQEYLDHCEAPLRLYSPASTKRPSPGFASLPKVPTQCYPAPEQRPPRLPA